MNQFSREQITAVHSAIELFRINKRYNILLAQMQSGKTDAFLLIACKMLSLNLIKRVVIFSGNSETELKQQLVERVKGIKSNPEDTDEYTFWDKYERLLVSSLEAKRSELLKELAESINDTSKACTIMNEITSINSQMDALKLQVNELKLSNKIQIYWGCELKKYTGETKDTLFIWEESHFAQSVTQQPDKFLNIVGIAANGNNELLEENNNFILTVSATPFSELSANKHFKQNKGVIRMMPGDGYNSVKTIKESGLIISYYNIRNALYEALGAVANSTKKYAIVRVTNKNYDNLIKLCESCNWNSVRYDSIITGDEKTKGTKVWKDMIDGVEPKENTVIFIRGMCRMGKSISQKGKQMLSFVMETSSASNTDTVLQGLFGRICGYGNYSVKVYLPGKIVNSGEIERYIELWDETNSTIIIPTKAMNILEPNKKRKNPIIPIKLHLSRPIVKGKQSQADIIREVGDLLDSDKPINTNCNEVYADILDTYNENINIKGNIKIHYCGQSSLKESKFNSKVYPEIENAHITENERCFGSGTGAGANDNYETHLWINGSIVYLTSYTEYLSEEEKEERKIPRSTLNEVFSHGLEDGEEALGNGGLTINLTPETAFSVEQMKHELYDLIKLSLDRNCERKIASNYDNVSKTYKGIYVKPDVLKSLQKKGEIYVYIESELGVKISCKGISGKKQKYAVDNNLERLASISW